MLDLKRKLGPLKVWQWALIGAALGVAVLIYNRGRSEETPAAEPGELFGGTGTGAFGPIDPETGIPYAFQGGGGSVGAAAGENLDEFLANIGKIADAGLLGGEPEAIETVITEPGHVETAVAHQAQKAENAKKKRDNGKKPATSAGGAAAAGGKSHTSAPHPAQRVKIGNRVPVSVPKVNLPGAGPKPAGAGSASSNGQVHPAAVSMGIGVGHPKPNAPAGWHVYQGANGQWWRAPN